jgi:hypothetical protein
MNHIRLSQCIILYSKDAPTLTHSALRLFLHDSPSFLLVAAAPLDSQNAVQVGHV